MTVTPPILFLIFNRPDKTAQILDRIRTAAPRRLYVAADGPRPTKPAEAQVCARTRAVIDSIDWDCEVRTLYRDTNLGCRRAVAEGITWFFEHEPEGIIIEDDIELDPSFFPFAAQMLERYRDNPKVMSITACNMQPAGKAYDASYYFSGYNHVWGWASWARAWALYDTTLDDLDSPAFYAAIDAHCDQPGARTYWRRMLHAVRDGQINTWDYSWQYTQWKAGGLTVTPRVNMMRNIGFDGSGTHTGNAQAFEASLRAHPLPQPLTHPTDITRDASADAHIATQIYGIRPYGFLRRLNLWRKGDRRAWL